MSTSVNLFCCPVRSGHFSAGNHVLKKEGAKKVTFSLSSQNGHPRTTFEPSLFYSYLHLFFLSKSYNGARKQGGKWPRAPLPARMGHHGMRQLALACRCPRVRSGAAKGKGGLVPFGGPGVACPCAPLSRAYTAAWSGGVGVACPSCAPLPREWERWGWGSRALARPFPVEGGREGAGGDGESLVPLPVRTGRRGQGGGEVPGAACPRAPPPAQMARVGRGWRTLACPFPACTRRRGRRDRGEREKAVAGALVCIPSVRMGRGQCGEGEEEEGDSPLCAPFLRSGGARSMREKGKRGGLTLSGMGTWVVLFRKRGAEEMGDGDGRREETGNRWHAIGPRVCKPMPPSPALTTAAPSPLAEPTCTRANGDATPSPSFSIRAEVGCTRARLSASPLPLPIPSSRHHSREKGAHDPPTPICAGRVTRHPVTTGPSPSPFDRAAVYVRERGMRRGVHEGTPPPAPPLPLGRAAPYAREGARGTPHHHWPLPFPLRRERGAQGLATPGPTFPFARKGRARGTHHPDTSRPRHRVRAGKGRAWASDPWPTLPIRVEGAHTKGTRPPFPLAAPLRTRGQRHARASCLIPWRPIHAGRGARGHLPPYVSCSRASAVSVRPRSPRPHLFSRAIVRLRQKK
ncbi:hypothetical protein EDB83DRAFT_2318506 [Lactarius deliciosus]|nr:hypothetical protein EDB83DRAFT_2318506 [Lactarius deliciosus]